MCCRVTACCTDRHDRETDQLRDVVDEAAPATALCRSIDHHGDATVDVIGPRRDPASSSGDKFYLVATAALGIERSSDQQDIDPFERAAVCEHEHGPAVLDGKHGRASLAVAAQEVE